MRGRSIRRMAESHVDLTPMLDVVFILLIFFIVTSTFAQEEAMGLEAPPRADGPSDPGQKAMLVAVTESGVITVDGRPTDIGSVRANIERVRAESPDVRILIQAHPKAKSGAIVLIRDAAYAAGYTEGVNFTIDRQT